MTDTRDADVLSHGAPRDPEELEAVAPPVPAEIPAQTSLGAVHLTVSGLDTSLAYYTEAIGLDVLELGDGRATLGSGDRALLGLVEEKGARPSRGYTGLYHFALLVSRRVDLARWLAHAARDRVRLLGLSDHFVSEAIYLTDPDGHGIEIYCDRPRDLWEGRVEAMTTLPLNVDSLLGELDDPATEPFLGLPTGTTMGHVHLKVATLPETITFYRDVLGFGLMVDIGGHAAFLSVGGYHHHIGANIWESAGASPPPPGTAALRHATIALPTEDDRRRLLDRVAQTGHEIRELTDGPAVVDPSGNALLLVVA